MQNQALPLDSQGTLPRPRIVGARLASPSAFLSKNSLIYGGSAKLGEIKNQEILCALCAFAVQGTLVP